MNILQAKPLKQRAESILSRSQTDYRKIVWLHGAVAIGASLLLAVIDILLSFASADAGGLSGMGIRSIFETIRSLLGLGTGLLLPFWQVGILYTSIRMTRQQNVSIPLLTRGFNRLGPVLRYYLLLIAITLGITMAASFVFTPLIAVQPVPAELEAVLLTLDETAISDPQLLLESVPVEQLLAYVLPVLLPMIIFCVAAVIFVTYRLRLSIYLLVDDPKVGAMEAAAISSRLTKGHKWSLFKLDVSFLWYSLLQLLCSCIAVLPTVLSVCGISTFIPGWLLYLVCQAVSSVGSLALLWWAGAKIEITYACAYDVLRTPSQQITTI